MICPNCKSEIQDNDSDFCPYCGYKIEDRMKYENLIEYNKKEFEKILDKVLERI